MAGGEIRVGISGWRYEPWRGEFYPKGLKQREELQFASRAFSTIEINGSFYSLQLPRSWQSWHDDTPDDFVFAVKAPKFITHVRRLREIDTPMANFFASGVLLLKQKLGPLLWQFPPNFQFDPATFEPFLATLPRDTDHAQWIAMQHNEKVRAVALDIDTARPLRHAVELRHPSFNDPDFISLLRAYDVAFVVADTAKRWLEHDDVTAGFVYARLHGTKQLYQSRYTDEELDTWAQRSSAWSLGAQPPDARLISARPPPRRKARHVFVYFDNTDKLMAPGDAKRLMAKLGLA
jgi:uncharacterized protein YecE (DUF72 family)